jgi:aspartyl-tRNA(Asn)/glutamyl-tRNA(Gln) amidotransferase subunit C
MADAHLDVTYVAHLARIRLTPEEEQTLGRQLDHILDYIKQLERVDVAGVEPTAHPFPLVNVVRTDVTGASLPHDQALRNAPAPANGLFMVPKIVE